LLVWCCFRGHGRSARAAAGPAGAAAGSAQTPLPCSAVSESILACWVYLWPVVRSGGCWSGEEWFGCLGWLWFWWLRLAGCAGWP
jgi:hypothetical protein